MNNNKYYYFLAIIPLAIYAMALTVIINSWDKIELRDFMFWENYFVDESYYDSYFKTSSTHQSTDDEYDYSYDADDDEPDYGHSHDVRYVTCPMCNGTGVFELSPGDMMSPRMTCSGCNGTGTCTEEQTAGIREMQRRANEAVYGNSSGSSSSRSGRSAYEIQRDLEKAYANLHDMERQYRHCSSGVAASQYPSMIANQRDLIRRLEEELMNAY